MSYAGPILSEFADSHLEIKVGKVNVDEEQELAIKFRVMSIPMFAVVKNGKIVYRKKNGELLKNGSKVIDGTKYVFGPDGYLTQKYKYLEYFEKLFTGLEKAKCTVFRLHLEPAWTNDNNYTYSSDCGITLSAGELLAEDIVAKPRGISSP